MSVLFRGIIHKADMMQSCLLVCFDLFVSLFFAFCFYSFSVCLFVSLFSVCLFVCFFVSFFLVV